MGTWPVACISVVVALAAAFPIAPSTAVAVDPCDGAEGCDYAVYQNLQAAAAPYPVETQAPGVTDRTSLKMVNPARPASVTYQVEEPQWVRIFLYSANGTFATEEPALQMMRLGSSGPEVDLSKALPCRVNADGEVFLPQQGEKLYYHPMVETPVFYSESQPPMAELFRYGLNLEAAGSGAFQALEPKLSQVEIYWKGSVPVAYGEWYEATLPAGTTKLRVTLRGSTQLAVYNSQTVRPFDNRLELAQVELYGGGFVQPVTPPSSSSQPGEGSSSLPPPDISGSDVREDDEDDEDNEEEEEEEDGKEDGSRAGSSAKSSSSQPSAGWQVSAVVEAAPPSHSAEAAASPAGEETPRQVTYVFASSSEGEGLFPGADRGIVLWASFLSIVVFVTIYWLLRR